jgi:hypothetical protein
VRRGPSAWAALAILALFVVLQHGGALGAPFFSDDYFFLDKLRGASLLDVFAPRDLAYHWYRPWSRELHFWVLSRLFGPHPLPFHVACFALWLTAMGLYFAFVDRLAGRAVAAIATAAAAAMAAWIVPIEWGPGAQDLWMLVFTLLALHAHARGRAGWASAALALALLSKETAAVTPAIAFAYSIAIERRTPRAALARCAPLLALTAVWAALHPALGGRLWWPHRFAALPAVRTAPLVSAAKSLLALVNLDLPPAPAIGWRLALVIAVPGALALAFLALRGVLAASAPAAPPEDARPAPPSPARIAAFGAVWMLAAWLPLLLPSVLWQSYYVLPGALGAWLVVSLALSRARAAAVPLVLALALLRGARAATPARDWGNVVLMRFGKAFMGATESFLERRLPAPPRHTRLFFTTVPTGVVFVTGPGDAPALRVWYADATIRGSFWADYRRRGLSDSIGPDYFFRYDSLAGWLEVRPGPENLRGAQAANPRWREDHEKLASTFVDAGEVRGAATEYEKLAGVHPDEAEYAYLLGLCFEQLGVADSAALWYGRAAALPGADEAMREKARRVRVVPRR